MATTTVISTQFPGTVLGLARTNDPEAVKEVQRRLNDLGCGPVFVDGIFGVETADAIELFQARFTDKFGDPLKVDGQVGPMTLGALFGPSAIPRITTSTSPLLSAALTFAGGEVGVMESPLGSNRGPRVDEYLTSVGANPATHSPWCAAFVYFCFEKSVTGSQTNPVIKTAGVLDHWNKAGAKGIPRLSTTECVANPSLVQPGMIFVLSTGSGHGHTGLVETVDGMRLTTIEGNTNPQLASNGIGVFRQTKRHIANINRGFIDYR